MQKSAKPMQSRPMSNGLAGIVLGIEGVEVLFEALVG
jgi:hypothetical protein